jgi:nucleotide-binding universal stress UspA family protein
MTTRVLCAIDAAYPSRPAVEAAVERARLLGVPMAFLAVAPACDEGVAKTRFWDDRIAAAVESHLRSILADASALARQAGLTDVECAVASAADIAAAIVDYARANGCDHIVIGSSRPCAPAGSAHGTIAADVERNADCPVTIVR